MVRRSRAPAVTPTLTAHPRLARIVELRTAGRPFQTPLADALERQVAALNRQLGELRVQQRVGLSLLQSPATQKRARTMSKEA